MAKTVLIVILKSPMFEHKWHIGRVTGRSVTYAMPKRKRGTLHPRTLLRSMLPEGSRIRNMAEDDAENSIVATVAGLTPDEIEEIKDDFENEYGMELDLKGKMSLF